MTQKKLEERIRTYEIPVKVDRVTAGWLLLMGRKVPQVQESPEPLAWKSEVNQCTQFFDWMAWLASASGWTEAARTANEELKKLPLGLGILNVYAHPDLCTWMQREWDTPPRLLYGILGHPQFLAAQKAAMEIHNNIMADFSAMESEWKQE